MRAPCAHLPAPLSLCSSFLADEAIKEPFLPLALGALQESSLPPADREKLCQMMERCGRREVEPAAYQAADRRQLQVACGVVETTPACEGFEVRGAPCMPGYCMLVAV